MFEIVDCSDKHCCGKTAVIIDEQCLVEALALILVQEYVVARNLVSGENADVLQPNLTAGEIDKIVSKRLKQTKYHRDGLLFQLMMWLCSHADRDDRDLISIPHTQGAAKGQDGLIIHRSVSEVVSLTICEDKATEHPRRTIRGDVWPEIQKYETGERDDELRSLLISTLGTDGVSMDEALACIRGVSWSGNRRYRVRITVPKNGRTKDLFKGFSGAVQGANPLLRRGDTIEFQNLRRWMTDISSKVEKELKKFVVVDNV